MTFWYLHTHRIDYNLDVRWLSPLSSLFNGESSAERLLKPKLALIQADGFGGPAVLSDPSSSAQPSQITRLLGVSKEHQQSP